MAKIHSRIKRRYGLSTSHGHYRYFHRKGKNRRPKTFNTEESANAWALKQGLKPEQYSLKNAKSGKKLQVVRQDRKGKLSS